MQLLPEPIFLPRFGPVRSYEVIPQRFQIPQDSASDGDEKLLFGGSIAVFPDMEQVKSPETSVTLSDTVTNRKGKGLLCTLITPPTPSCRFRKSSIFEI